MGVSASVIARVLGIDVEFVNLRAGRVQFLPQRIAVFGQGSSAIVYPSAKAIFTSSIAVANLYGFGSPVHLASRKLLPDNGDGIGTIPMTIFPLQEGAAATASAGDITPTVAPTENSTYQLRVGGVLSQAFSIIVGDNIADVVAKMKVAIDAVLESPVTTVDNAGTKLDVTSKWKGISANDISIQVLGDLTIGNSFAFTQPVGGTVNPTDLDDALALMGGVWETMILNCLDIADTTNLEKYRVFGEGRWGELSHNPLVAFTGNNEADQATAIVVTDARKTDRVNSQLAGVGSVDLPFVVAARQLARDVVLANENPPHDYGSQIVDTIEPGTDGEQWTYPERDAAVKGGSSTVTKKNGVMVVGDTITMFHPDGDANPAYRYVVDIVRLQNIIFNVNLEFSSPEWDGAPLLPDGDPTNNPTAKYPKTAKAALAAIIDSLGLAAIISDPTTAKESITAEIDGGNPKRLNLGVTVQLSGNTNITSIDLKFGFFFGG